MCCRVLWLMTWTRDYQDKSIHYRKRIKLVVKAFLVDGRGWKNVEVGGKRTSPISHRAK